MEIIRRVLLFRLIARLEDSIHEEIRSTSCCTAVLSLLAVSVQKRLTSSA